MAGTQPKDPGSSVGRLAPWCPAILEASIACEVDPYLGCGILLRESWAGWSPGYSPKGSATGWGDGGKAFSPWQFDIRWNRSFIESPGSDDPRAQAMRALGMVADDYEYFRRSFPNAPESMVWDAAVAAYNAGRRRVYRALDEGRRPADVTTGRDYPDDVLARAAILREEHPHLFMPRAKEIA